MSANLHESRPLTIYLVSTTDAFRNSLFDPTQLSAPLNPKNRRSPSPVEKAGLVGQRLFGLALGYEDLGSSPRAGSDRSRPTPPLTRSWRSLPASLKRTEMIAHRWRASRH